MTLSVPHIFGRVALVAQRPIVVKLSRGRSVGPYVRRSVCPVHCGKTADRIRLIPMPFGIVGRTQKRNRKKTALANKTIYTLIWYAFYDLQPGNGVGAILTALEPTPCTVRETYGYGT